MALPTTYSTGTATVNGNETAVTGQGTTWLTSALQGGDLFWAGGMSVRIASVNSNTSLTLAFAWPGASRAAQQYEIRFTPDATRVLASARAVLDAIAGGNVKAFGDLMSAVDKLGYFTGAGTMGLVDFKSVARQFLAANFMPIEQGGGAGQVSNKLRLGWSGTAIKAQVDNTDLGKIWTDFGLVSSLSASGYCTLPNGIILQWLRTTLDVADQYKVFPITFPGACLAAQATVVGNAPTSDTTFVLTVDGLSVAGFNLRGRYAAGGAVGPQVGLVASILAVGI